jgi:hypothetical protein
MTKPGNSDTFGVVKQFPAFDSRQILARSVASNGQRTTIEIGE